MFSIFKRRAKRQQTESRLDSRISEVKAAISAEKTKARAELAKAIAALAECEHKAQSAPREFAGSFRAEIACR